MDMNAKYHLDNSFVNNPIQFGDMLLHQLGRMHFMPSAETDEHVHLKWYELTIVTGGKGSVSTNGVVLPVEKGDIYLSFPGDFHQVSSSKENPLQYDFFSFYSNNPVIEDELKRFVITSYSYKQRIFHDERIQSGVLDAIFEFSEKEEYYQEVLECIFNKILFNLIRDTKRQEDLNTQNHVTITEEMVFQMMHYIDTHIYEMENLTELSRVFNYNYSYLSAVFKRISGDTISNYYQVKRLDTAKLLLKSAQYKIVEVAEILKYSSPYSFSKAFKMRYGVSPKYYKTEQLKIKE